MSTRYFLVKATQRVLNFVKYFTSGVTQYEPEVYAFTLGQHQVRLWVLESDFFWHDPQIIVERMRISEGEPTSLLVLCKLPNLMAYEISQSLENARKWYGMDLRVEVYGLNYLDAHLEQTLERILMSILIKHLEQVVVGNPLLREEVCRYPCPNCFSRVRYYVAQQPRPTYLYGGVVRDYFILCPTCGLKIHGIETVVTR